MKHFTLLATALCGSTGLALAQFNPENLNFGVTAGLCLTNLVYKEDGQKPADENRSPGLGLRLGGFARYQFNESWGVQPGLELTTVSSTAKFQGDKTRTSVVSLALPVPLTYTLPVGEKAVIFNAGPLVRFNMSGKVKGDGFSENLKFGPNAAYRRFTPGLQLGVAYRIPVPRLFRSRASRLGGADDDIDYIITGIDGTVVETVYKYKSRYNYSENLWTIMLRFFWNFSTNQRDNRGTKF
ncbi:MAG: PorT family protein [Sphingobacteriaceae bacterium]|nr:PorT family protein [Cytophagaceae bacterium]